MMIAVKSISSTRLRSLVACSKYKTIFSPFASLRAFATSTTTTDAASSDPPPVPPVEPKFYVPKAERGNRSIFSMDYMVGETRLSRNSRTCPTRELYFQHMQWTRHKSPYRKFRHMANLFRAAPFQRLLFPDLFCVSAVAGCLTYYNEIIVAAATDSSQAAVSAISMSPSAFAGATTAIGLLAGFRLNTSYGRYNEGRKYWSSVNTTTRDLARQTMMWVKNKNNDNNKHGDTDKLLQDAQARILRLCQAFPITLMFHLNDKGCHHDMKRRSKTGEAPYKDRVQAEFRAELQDVYGPATSKDQQKDNTNSNNILNDDFERILRIKLQGGNVPLEVLTCMGETIGALSDDEKVNPVYIRELDMQVQRLCQALGSCERLLKTPLPTGFTRHSSRLLFIWSNCLPFALYPLMGPLGTLPTSLLTSYAVLGIEDISVQLEECFDILPLRQFSDSMFDGIRAIEEGYSTPHSNNAAVKEDNSFSNL